jgi:ABC-type antimicrobial peptide transport system permease subunit
MADHDSRTRRALANMAWLRAWADLLDSRFRVPGTQIRFGIDPLLSLIPGLGEMASPIFAIAIIAQSFGQGVPKFVIARMVANALIDACLGAVPIAGNVADIFWRANNLNMALLERHAQPGRTPTPGDYAFLFAIAAVLGLLAAVPVFVGVWLVWTLAGWAR